MTNTERDDPNKKFSIKETIDKSKIMPQAIKDKSNTNRIILITILILLPILIILYAYLSI